VGCSLFPLLMSVVCLCTCIGIWLERKVAALGKHVIYSQLSIALSYLLQMMSVHGSVCVHAINKL
jgi:hypothetical protein